VSDVENAANAADDWMQDSFADAFNVEGVSALATDAIAQFTRQPKRRGKTWPQVCSLEGARNIEALVGSTDRQPGGARAHAGIAGASSSAASTPARRTNWSGRLSAFAAAAGVFSSTARPALCSGPAGSSHRTRPGQRSAIADLQRGLALTNQARALVLAIVPPSLAGQPERATSSTAARERPLATRDQAFALRDALVGQIDTELEVNDPPAAVARASPALRAAVVRDVAARSDCCSSAAPSHRQAVLPALVIAHRVYQDATRADELALRNGIVHPGFAPARCAGGAALNDANACTLKVNGTVYGGWTGIEIHRSIEHIAGGFVLEVTSRYPGLDVPMQLREGLPCEVWLGDDLVISGYIDEYETDDSPEHSSVKLIGRDKTGDLVDCSAIYKTGQWSNVSLQQIVADIAKPFGITVTSKTAWTSASASSTSPWRKARRPSSRSTAPAGCAPCW
jgi:hypothetical protein